MYGANGGNNMTDSAAILGANREAIFRAILARHPRNTAFGRELLVGSFNTPLGLLTTGDKIYTASGNEGTFIGMNPRTSKMPLVYEAKTGEIFKAGRGALRTIIEAE
jgi:hypothetical protein